MNREMKKIRMATNNIFLEAEIRHSKKTMTNTEFKEYIKEKRRISRKFFDDLYDMDIKDRRILLERMDISDLFIRERGGKVFYDEYELNRLR